MGRHRGEQRPSAVLEVFDLRVVDEGPPSTTAPPAHRHWHLWHRWELMRVDAHTTYVACASCGRLRTPTIFESPVV